MIDKGQSIEDIEKEIGKNDKEITQIRIARACERIATALEAK